MLRSFDSSPALGNNWSYNSLESETQNNRYERYLDDLLSSEITKTIDNLTELVMNTKRSLTTLHMKDEADLFPMATPYMPVA